MTFPLGVSWRRLGACGDTAPSGGDMTVAKLKSSLMNWADYDKCSKSDLVALYGGKRAVVM